MISVLALVRIFGFSLLTAAAAACAEFAIPFKQNWQRGHDGVMYGVVRLNLNGKSN